MTTHAKLAEKLQAHPILTERMLALIDIVEAEPGRLDRASEAEDAVIEQVREMGKELLTDWGVSKIARASTVTREQYPEAIVRKKTSTGPPPTER